MKKIYFIFLLILSLFIVSCQDKENENKISALETIVSVEEGKSYTIEFTSKVGNCLVKSDNDNIRFVKVDEGFVEIEALKEGTSVITIYKENDESIYVTINVTITKKKSSFEATIENILCGETKEIKLKYDADFQDTDFEFKTTSEIISLDGNKVTGLKPGEATISITEKKTGEVKELKVTVMPLKVTDIEANIPEVLYVGDEFAYDVKVLPEKVLNKEYKIESTNTDVLLIKDNKILALKDGIAKIIITSLDNSEVKKEYSVKVVDKSTLVSKIIVDAKNTMKPGEKQVLSIQVLPKEALIKDYKITVTDETILKVEGDTVEALKEGKTTVIVSSCDLSNVSVTIEIEVKNKASLEELLEWAFSQIGTRVYEEVILPTSHPEYDCTFEWASSDETLLCTDDGMLDFVEFNADVDLTCKVIYDGEVKEETRKVTVLGTAFGDLAQRFTSQFKANKIVKSMNLVTEYPDYYGGSSIEWSSSDESIFTNEGEFNKPIDDSIVTITYIVKLGSPKESEIFTIDLKVDGKTISDVLEDIEKWIDENVCTDGFIDEDTVLPTLIDEYRTEVEWLDSANKKLNIKDFAGNPIFQAGINVKIKLTYKGKSAYLTKHYNIKSKTYTDMWDLIKLFTDTISKQPITTYTYSLVSWTGMENGYVPFYDNANATIVEDILPYTYGNQRTNIKKTSTEYVVVHDTGNPNKGANAEMHNRYIKNLNAAEGSTSISWHFTVGDDGIYQHLPLDEVAYHAGDGSHVFGDTYYNTSFGAWSIGGGNRNGIGIESCINNGVDYTVVMRKLAKLVSELLIQFNLGIDRVKQHNAFSGKNCPQVMRENNRWEEFLILVQLEYFAKTQLKDVKFEWTPKTDNIDVTGRVKNPKLTGEKVAYEVKVTYKGEVKTFSYENVILNR